MAESMATSSRKKMSTFWLAGGSESWYINPLPAYMNASACRRLASVQIIMSASPSCHKPMSTNHTPIALGIFDASQVKSDLTSALIKTPRHEWVLPCIFQYSSVNAGLPQGSTFKSQLRWPVSHSQSRGAGLLSCWYCIMSTIASIALSPE